MFISFHIEAEKVVELRYSENEALYKSMLR